jgi:hypothetical protein
VKKRLSLVFVLLCLITLPALAANKRWQIVRADYGSGNHWVDVTDRVQSLVQNNVLTLTVNGSTLASDTRRGRNRSLRLQLKDNKGQSKQLTYRDNQRVSLPIYSSNTSNREALRIVSAVYGNGNRTVDVTNRLNSQISGNQINLTVTNANMGSDPDPGQSKNLNVEYTFNGQRQQAVTREGETLRLPYSNTVNGALFISRATYGSQNRRSDVTDRLNSQVQDNQLILQVNNDTMGGDPDRGADKNLNIEYTLNGRSEQTTVREGENLHLAYNSPISNALQITRAIYGSAYRSSDVTARLASQMQADHISLQVNNNTMGGDPSPGQSKTLTVQYAFNGQNSQVMVNEGQILNLPYNVSNSNVAYDSNNPYNNNGLAQRIRCDSGQANNYGRQYCSANTRGGVRLTRTLNNSQCVQDSSWGYDNNGVWVDKGCSAEFELLSNNRSAISSTSGTISNGTELSVRTNEVIDSSTASVGQSYSAQIATDILDSSGAVTIPRGSDARLVIRSSSGGSVASSSDLVLDVDTLTISGTKYQVSTGDLDQKGGQGIGANKKTAVMVGGGAAIGTIIGAIVGGGKGAAIGAAIGAGAGAGTEILTKGKQVKIPAETLLSFKLDQDLKLRAVR